MLSLLYGDTCHEQTLEDMVPHHEQTLEDIFPYIHLKKCLNFI